MYSASPRMERRVRVSCLDQRMPALLLVVAIVGREGRQATEASSQAAGYSFGGVGKLWVFSACFQEPAGSFLSGHSAEKAGLRTTLLAGRPQGNESYRADVRIILSAREAVLPVYRFQGICSRLWEFIHPWEVMDCGLNGLITKGLAFYKGLNVSTAETRDNHGWLGQEGNNQSLRQLTQEKS